MPLAIRHCPWFVILHFEHTVVQRDEVYEYICIYIVYNIREYKYYALDMWSGKNALFCNCNTIFVDFPILFHCRSMAKSNYNIGVRQA
jgi:hypothetical protein